MAYRWTMGLIALALSLAAGAAPAQTAGVALSEKSAYFTYGRLVGGQSFGRNELGFGLLYNTDDTFIFHAGLEVSDEVGTNFPGLEAGVGGRLNLANRGDTDVLAFAIGGHLRYRLPNAERFALAGEGYYAPDIVTFLDARSFWTWSLQGEYEILPTATVYLGYRRFEAGLRGGADMALDKGLRAGVQVRF